MVHLDELEELQEIISQCKTKSVILSSIDQKGRNKISTRPVSDTSIVT
ncbi:hypothetical protein IH779_01755 [Patescibacteria group bacterium]|nr:hypothetical protein [Patescibacteria group bacterium]